MSRPLGIVVPDGVYLIMCRRTEKCDIVFYDVDRPRWLSLLERVIMCRNLPIKWTAKLLQEIGRWLGGVKPQAVNNMIPGVKIALAEYIQFTQYDLHLKKVLKK